MVPIADVLLASPQATIDFASIPQGYAHLFLVFQGRHSGAAPDVMAIRFNGDSGANYDFEKVQPNGSTTTSFEFLAQTSLQSYNLPGTNAPGTTPGSVVVDIPNYAATAFEKTCHLEAFMKTTLVAGAMYDQFLGGTWRSTAAINRITLSTNSGSSFVAGTRVTLYGISATVPAVIPPAITAPVAATTLPTNPGDGQQAILVDSTTTPTWSWLLQWSAAAARWLFVGGSSAFSEVATSENVQSATYVDAATVGPQFTVPRAGDYLFAFGAFQTGDINANTDQYIALKFGAATTVDTDGERVQNSGGATNQVFRQTITRTIKRTVAAGTLVKMQYRASGTNLRSYDHRWLQVTPVSLT